MRFAPQTIPAPGSAAFGRAGNCGPLDLEASESEPLRLPGGTTIFPISRRGVVHNEG